jgi:uncharacterized protein involved in outer membrane biogenesis
MLKWVGGILVVAVLGLIVYLSWADLGWLGPKVEEIVGEATGRELDLGEDLSIDLLPTPTVRASGVTFANADWGSEPQLATVGHVAASVNLWSLVSGPIRVESLRLEDVSVLIETNADGESNLSMGTAADEDEAEFAVADDEPAEGGIPALVENGEIRNVVLTVRAPEQDDKVFTVESLDLETSVGQMDLDGHGTVNEQAWNLVGSVGGRMSVEDPLLVDLEGALGNLEVDIEGKISDSPTLEGTELGVDISSEDVAPLLAALDVPIELSGPLRIESEIAQLEEHRRLTADLSVGGIEARIEAIGREGDLDVEATLPELDKIGAVIGSDALPALALHLDGGITVDDETIELRALSATLGDTVAVLNGSVAKSPEGSTAVDLKVEGASLAQLAPTLPELPFSLVAVVKQEPQKVILEGFDVTFGDSDLHGELTVETGEATRFVGRIDSQLLDFSPFVPQGEETAEAEAGAGATETAAAESDGDGPSWVFTEDPLPFDTLRTASVDLRYEIARLIPMANPLLDLNGSLVLDQGKLDLDSRFEGPAGGRFHADITLDATKTPATLDTDFQIVDLVLKIGDTDAEIAPRVELDIDVDSMGDSMRALASSAWGDVLLYIGPGKFEKVKGGMLSNDFISEFLGALNPFRAEETHTVVECFIFKLGIEDGLSDIEAMLFQSDKLMVIGKGDIDLDTEKLNMEFNTKPREGVGLSMAGFVTPFVQLKGTLAEPGIGLDKSGVLLSGGAALATGGMSFLYKAVADRATAGGDRCAEVLAEVRGEPLPESASPEENATGNVDHGESIQESGAAEG